MSARYSPSRQESGLALQGEAASASGRGWPGPCLARTWLLMYEHAGHGLLTYEHAGRALLTYEHTGRGSSRVNTQPLGPAAWLRG